MDFGTHALKYSAEAFFSMFAFSRVGREFAAGHPSFIAGRSGIELALLVVEQTVADSDNSKTHGDAHSDKGIKSHIDEKQMSAQSLDAFWNRLQQERSPEFWVGWAVAYYQWLRNLPFSEILRFISVEQILAMYQKYHEIDIRHFSDALDKIRSDNLSEAKLKQIRRIAGYSQKLLAQRSGVPLRTIQQYEQKQKNINNAQAVTVMNLASALGCDPKALLENESLNTCKNGS